MNSIYKRITVIFFVTLLAALVVPLYFTRGALENSRLMEAKNDASANMHVTTALLSEDVSRFLKLGIASPRLSHILEGDILNLSIYDLHETHLVEAGNKEYLQSGAGMGNGHPEVLEAMQKGKGTSIRNVGTPPQRWIFAAEAADGYILRTATPFADTWEALVNPSSGFLFACTVWLLCCFAAALLFVHRIRRTIDDYTEIVEEMSSGTYTRRLRRLAGKELVPFAVAINKMARELNRLKNKSTDRRNRLQAIVDSVPDGVLVLDGSTHIRNFNPALLRMFGNFHQAYGKPLVDVMPDFNLQQAIEKSMEQNTTVVESLQLELGDGRVFLVSLTRLAHERPPLQPVAAEHPGLVIVFTEITRLMHLERVRKDFVANVSHELRTPLTAIQGYAETIAEVAAEGNTQNLEKFALIIFKQARRMNRLVEDLLALSRLENDRQPLGSETTSAERVTDDALALFSKRREQKNLRFETAFEKPDTVKMRDDHLLQVIVNLLDNAVRFSPTQGLISVHGECSGNFYKISVTDEGPGLPLEEREKIFERFYKGKRGMNAAHQPLAHQPGSPERATQPGESAMDMPVPASGGATGLGLSICRHIVERYGGNITTGNVAKGAEFICLLPVCSSSTDDTL